MEDVSRGNALHREFDEVWSQNVTIVERVCWLYLGRREEVQDAVQRVRIRKWIHFDNYNPAIGFAAWVRTNARHVCIEIYRRSKRRVEEDELPGGDGEYLVGHEASYFAEDAVLGRLSSPELVDAMMRLPDAERIVVVCRYLDGLTLQESAQHLGITFSQVRTREANALKHLRQTLESGGANI